jgi:hypothetical protein
MLACSKTILVRLAPREYQNLAELAALREKSLSDIVREHLLLPPESETRETESETCDNHSSAEHRLHHVGSER